MERNLMKKNILIKLIVLLSVMLISFFVAKKVGINLFDINVDSLSITIKSFGKYAFICFLIILTLKPLMMFLPAAVFSVVGGTIFGSVKGFTLNMIGFFLSGTVAFLIARNLGKKTVDKLLRGKGVKLNNNLSKNGFKVLFLLRLPPVLPYDPLSYACGLTKIKYKDFIYASLLGVVPETLCYSIMGQNIFNPNSPKFIIPFIIIIISTLVSGIFFKKANL
ncbi:TVP38/TMEM64 family protein [Clostridium tetani]|uniref:TVP38/TMEM64 family membrane protein n=2 Tax=Clostridium tetani TaxID=1513 RepID=A0ABY0EMJ7_CLOTA|nr:TVP38/TMEM64 family protein [Clostridium tetani]RXI53864.1 TVP38/TMEM64 family protein [Clostridium tetani]RXI73475.1 TVP38/TMEM64 family protein [Clostridium tetani]